MLAKKCVIIVLIVMSITLFALEAFLDAYHYRPVEPQPAHGRIYAAKVVTSFLFGWLLNMRWKQFLYQKKIK